MLQISQQKHCYCLATWLQVCLRKQHKLTNARLYAWLHFWMHGKGAKTALMPLFDHEMAEETARLVIGSFHDGD
jgi:hypothetical protein